MSLVMPRPLVFGNGSLLINLDARGQIRDLYWPYVGMPNHLQGYAIRLGFWVDGHFAWLDDPAWSTHHRYEPGTLVGTSVHQNHALALKVTVRQAVHPRLPIFVREFELESLNHQAREVRIFQNNDLRIAETDIGDTALYHPFTRSMIHYKGPYAFILGGESDTSPITDTTTGMKAFNGAEGTWRDAEDGALHPNPISQGSVDSTFCVPVRIEPGQTAKARFWIVCGESIPDAENLLNSTSLDDVVELSRRWWRVWSDSDPTPFDGLSDEVQELYQTSLALIASQCDDEGAILAANDSDIMQTNRATYSFLWPRDGALVAMVTDSAGHHEIGEGFVEMCLRLLPHDRPMLLHKYAPDGSLGASWHPWVIGGTPEVPTQQDETSLTVVAIEHHLRLFQNADKLERWYTAFVAPTCTFMAGFIDDHGLPKPTWDLWEERRGVHAYTVATTIAAFRAAAWMANLLGDEREELFLLAEQNMKSAALEHLWQPSAGVFARRIDDSGHKDHVLDSATLAFGLLGVFDPHHEAVVRTANTLENALRCREGIDGMARYQHDYYFRRTDDFPGNPWVICSMWLAQTRMLQATNLKELDSTKTWLDWAVQRATSSMVLSEQYHPVTGEALSVSPLTWSHAEFARSVQLFQRRARELQRT